MGSGTESGSCILFIEKRDVLSVSRSAGKIATMGAKVGRS